MSNSESKRNISVQFVNFWRGFEQQSYALVELFQKHFEQTRVNANPDIVFFADRIKRIPKIFDKEKFKDSVSVFYSGENTIPALNTFDYSFTFADTTEKNFQLPIYARQKYYFDFINQTEPNVFQQSPAEEFCNFIYRNTRATERINFCKRLQTYKHVGCPGEVLNNMPNFATEGRRSQDWMADKIKFIAKYKFTIAFENEAAPNYITEKLFDPLYAGSIPIYWGAPNVTEFFNPECFINVRDYNTFDEVIERIKEIDNNEEMYQNMLAAAPIHDTSKLKECNEKNIIERFATIVNEVAGR